MTVIYRQPQPFVNNNAPTSTAARKISSISSPSVCNGVISGYRLIDSECPGKCNL